jgi:NAD(P)-dependent dehydrogenase (short-subunit alcohol dehydrogenase family)
MDLKGKTAFVTGAGSGIGRASARAFARAGARVAAIDVNPDGLRHTVQLIEEGGGTALALIADVTDPHSVRGAVSETVRHFGGLDCAHNNAGIASLPTDFADYPIEDFKRIFEVNVFGVVHCMQAQIEVMLARGGGTIVNTASGAGLVAVPRFSAYGSSKHAVVGLTKCVALEYAARGIRINSVCPGFVVGTAQTDPLLSSREAVAATIALHPIGRLGDANEIANAVVWLSSDQASYCVGLNMPVDGGYTVP